MILILENEADREAFQTRSPFNPEFYTPGMKLPTVWISPEAYLVDEQERFDATVKWVREDEQATAQVQMADLRAKVEALLAGAVWPVEADAFRAVLALLDGGGDDSA